ncbi:MAG TPA: patatin-like phospholipase family protein, partial [Thermoanaerobaculia bacterium]|nr:patatin-like phospholipase family protein [Thermoanaerobaculia bacterium]
MPPRGPRRPAARQADRESAIILSGGGAKGAYSVGVMKAILSGASPSTFYQPLDPAVYTGSSVGAYNAAIMGSQPGKSPVAAVEQLEKLWRGPIAEGPGDCGNGIFRLRGLPVQGFEPGCFRNPVGNLLALGYDALFLGRSAADRMGRFVDSDLPLAGRFMESFDLSAFFDPQPLYELVETTVSRPGLQQSGKRVAVAASNWQTGEARVFWNEDLVVDDQLRSILASMAIPGIFPLIDIHGVPYVDGGLSMNTPLKPALQAGANV